jgi:hypothetical protein
VKPAFDAEEDLGSPEKRYRKVHATQIVAGGDGAAITAGNILSCVTAVGCRVAYGQKSTVAAADTIVTGLTTVIAVVASMDSDPVDDPFMCSATIGDQAGSPAAGSIIVKTWKNTGGTDPTPAAAGTFTKKVNWIAIGT